MALGDPVQQSATLRQDDKGGYSEASLRELRDYVKALMSQKQSGNYPFTLGSGLERLSHDFMAGYLGNLADQRERATLTGKGSDWDRFLKKGKPEGPMPVGPQKTSAIPESGSPDYYALRGGGLPAVPPGASVGAPGTASLPGAPVTPARSSMYNNPATASDAGAGGPGADIPFYKGGGTQALAALMTPSKTQSKPLPTQAAAEDLSKEPMTVPPSNIDPEFEKRMMTFEGYKPNAYQDYHQYSIGYGSRANSPNEVIDKNEARKRLQDDIYSASKVVDSLGVPLAKGQREALISLTMDAGPKWVTSGLGQAVKNNDWDTAKNIFVQYNKAGGKVLPGLVDRRMKELSWTGAVPDIEATQGIVDQYRQQQLTGRAVATPPPVPPTPITTAQASPPSAPPPPLGAPPGAPMPIRPPAAVSPPPVRAAQAPAVPPPAPAPLPPAAVAGTAQARPNVPFPVSPYGNEEPSATPVQRDLGTLVGNLARRGQLLTPAEMQEAAKLRLGTGPQYQLDPQTGNLITTVPGQPPFMTPNYPGFHGAISNIPGTPFEGMLTTDKEGRPIGRQILPLIPPLNISPPAQRGGDIFGAGEEPTPGTAPAPRGTTPPVTAPTPAPGSVPAPPSRTPAPPSAPAVPPDLGALPAGTKLAAAGPVSGDPAVGMRLAQAAAGAANEPTNEELKKLPTNSPPDREWKKVLNEAASKPAPQIGEGEQPPNPFDMRPEHMSVYSEKKKAYETKITEQAKEQSKMMGERLKSIHETGAQARKQAPGLKLGLNLLKEGKTLGLEQGPAAEVITLLKSLRGEAGRIGEKYNIPYLKELAKQEGGDPNQVLVKLISTLTLENMRSMLGPGAGPFRQYETILMRQSLGGQELSPGAQRTVFEMIDKLNDRMITYDDMATAWENKFHSLDSRFINAQNKFDREHPMFQPGEFDKYMKALTEEETKAPAVKPAPAAAPPATRQQLLDEMKRRGITP
jgi:lysozyme